MARIAERRLRPIWIYRMSGGVNRSRVATVDAFSLPDAVARWYEAVKDEMGYHDPLFTANTVAVRTADGEQEVYVATD